MRHQIEIAEPGEQRPPVAAEGNTVEAGIGDRHRLNDDRPVVAPQLRHAEQGAAEWQHARAVAAGPSGNSIRFSPVFSRFIISSRLSLVLFERRSTKIVRCALASVLKNGQVATSAALATKQPE